MVFKRCCCLHIKSRFDLYSVLSNIRTGPTDADAFRGHRLTTQKGYTLCTRIILVQITDMRNIFRLLIRVPDYSSESYREKQKLIGFIITIISQRGVCKS